MANYNPPIDQVFQALSDPTRREVIRQLISGPASVKTLSASHDMALPSFMKHISVLEESELITTQKEGRVRTCRIRPETLSTAEQWITDTRLFWEQRLDALGEYLETKSDNSI
jgi:DNA-binding transcriptional ArsR family regulator